LPAVSRQAIAVAAVVAGAAVVTVLAAIRFGELTGSVAAGGGFLLAASVAAEAFPVPIVGVTAGATSLATIFIVGASVLYSWQVAALIGLLTMGVVESRRRTQLVRALYNAGLYVLSGAAAGIVAAQTPSLLAAVLAAATSFYAVNIGLLVLVVAASSGESYARVFHSFVLSTLGPFAVMASTTAILVELWRTSAYVALLLLPPLVTIAWYQRSLHRAMERQRELDRLKEDFIAVVSHELRTPLATVYGGVETLLRPGLRPEVRDSLFRAVRQEAARLARLVDDVLWASRLDASPRERSADAVDPSGVIQDVTASARSLAPDGVQLVTAAAADLPRVGARREHLERILGNLVENAIKYSPDGGTVEVTATVVGERVWFSVKDEGIGVPENQRERIFEKFTRLDPQMTRGVGGTGLGLYICRELVRQMGGDIRCTANAGPGTTFTFDVPITTQRSTP
jgi:signal transduction histidine kinase